VNGRAPRSVRFGLAQDLVGDGGGIPLPEEQEAEEVHDRVALRPTEVAVRRLAGGISQMKQAAQANNTAAARIPSSAGRWSIRLLLMPLPSLIRCVTAGMACQQRPCPPLRRGTRSTPIGASSQGGSGHTPTAACAFTFPWPQVSLGTTWVKPSDWAILVRHSLICACVSPGFFCSISATMPVT
jgi:hypothetical protein